MSLTARDRKIALILVPVLLLAGYWFLILAPQRTEVSSLDQKLVAAESARDQSVLNQQNLTRSRSGYANDYATVVRLGKAIPSTLDMPSLLVQLESAAKGTGIDFDSITVGARTTAATPAADSTAAGASSSAAPVESGGEKAQTGTGKTTEKANDAAGTANERNQAGGATSTSGQEGTTAAASPVAGLDTVPLNFSFQGSYFELADFFHRVKRFVRVANSDIQVKGRLMTIDGMNLTTKGFPRITAKVSATVYLSPKSEGATGGGTAQGPTATPASSATPAASSSSATSSSSSTPAPAQGSSGAAQ